MPKKKLIELLIDEDADAFGVEAISLVKHPAIESNFVYFSKQERGEMVSLAKVDEEQRTLIGAALIPDKRIPRYDEFSDEEYDVYFSKQTCKQAAELFLKTHRTSEWTEEHENKVDGVHVVESWIVADPKVDKAHHFGLEVPEGTWMVRVQVENEEMWKFVKEQKVAGFSIEGYFLDKLEEMTAQPKPSLGRKLKSLVTGRKLYAEIETDAGATFATEDDEFTAGVSVYKIGAEGTAVEVDNGTYKTKAGTEFEVYEGVVTEWDGQVKEVEEKDTEEKTATLKEEYRSLYEKKLEALTLHTMSRHTQRRKFASSAVRTFEEYFDVNAIKRAHDSGETLIVTTWMDFIDIFGGVEQAHQAMEDIEWDLGIYLEVSDYNDVVVNWHGY